MSIPKQFVDELRTRLPVSEVIGKRIKVTRAGREFKACCPFHNEKTPSFTINDQKGFYHCFGCGAHGDVVGFMMQHDNLSFVEAVEHLAALAGMTVPQASPEERRKYERQKTLYDVTEAATKWFHQYLLSPQGRVALDYLLNRGITMETIERFRIGFAPNDRSVFVNEIKKQNISFKELDELGLARKSKNGNTEYSFFRGRVIFPVSDQRGRVVAFGGRILPQYDVKDGNFTPPKYLNSPDNPLFHKGRLLYGLSQARQAGAAGSPIILAEGYMDVIALSQAGIEGGVAPLGTALTESQIALLWKICSYENKVPYLCFDGDTAGRRAAFRALERILPLLKPDHSAKIIFMQEGEDPDSLIQKGGRQAFLKLLDQSMPLFEALWLKETEGRPLDTPEAKAGLKDRLEQLIFTIEDKTVQSFYLREVNNYIYQKFRNNNQWSGGRKKQKAGNVPTLKLRRPTKEKGDVRASVLLACMINHLSLLNEYEEELFSLVIHDSELAQVRDLIIEMLPEINNFEEFDMKQHLYDKGCEKVLANLLSNKTYLHAPFAKSDAEPEDVTQGWENTVEMIKQDGVIMDLRKAGTDIAKDGMSDHSASRLKSLGQLVLDKEGEDRF